MADIRCIEITVHALKMCLCSLSRAVTCQALFKPEQYKKKLATNQNASLIIDHFLDFTNNDNDNKKTFNKRHKIINEIKTGKRIVLKIFD